MERGAGACGGGGVAQRSIERATGIVFNITGGTDLTLQEVNTVSEVRAAQSPTAMKKLRIVILGFGVIENGY